MHSKYLTVFAAFVVILVAATALSTTDNVYADKRGEEYSQTQSLVNECELNCVNSAPQNQGDGAVLAPTVSVSGGQNEQGPGGIGEQNEQGPGGIGEQAGSDQELQVRQVPGLLVQVLPGNLGEALATCAADEVVTGGGSWIQDSNNMNAHVFSAKASNSESWLVQLPNPGPGSVIIQAFAECAKLVDAP